MPAPGAARPAPPLRRALDLALGGCCTALLAGLVGLTVVDVIGRYWFNAPVSGAFEMTQLMLGALVFAGDLALNVRHLLVIVPLIIDVLLSQLEKLLGMF